MRRLLVPLLGIAIALLTAAPALALPTTVDTSTLHLNGRVRSVVRVGGLTWVGGKFTEVQADNGSVVANVHNVAVFNSSGGSVDIAPDLPDGEVWDMDLSGGDVVIGGKFAINTSQKNLVKVNGSTGGSAVWFQGAPIAKAVEVASNGRVYAGGTTLAAWSLTGTKIFAGKTKVTIDPSLRAHTAVPAYRDLLFDGSALWAACHCDTAGGSPSKAFIKLDADGNRLAFEPQGAGEAALGIAVTTDGSGLYLGAGGSDFVAKYSFTGSQIWKRDTSGSTQAVGFMEGNLVIGGHFVEVADAVGDSCGFRSSDPGTLDPNNQCQTRKYLAAYSTSGVLQGWSVAVTGAFNGVWSLRPEGSQLYFGGEFKKVDGIPARYYAHLT